MKLVSPVVIQHMRAVKLTCVCVDSSRCFLSTSSATESEEPGSVLLDKTSLLLLIQLEIWIEKYVRKIKLNIHIIAIIASHWLSQIYWQTYELQSGMDLNIWAIIFF